MTTACDNSIYTDSIYWPLLYQIAEIHKESWQAFATCGKPRNNKK